MKAAALNRIAQLKKINLDHFDSVSSMCDEDCKFIYVTFGDAQVCGGKKTIYNQYTVKIRFRNAYDFAFDNGMIEDDLYTKGFEWISDIKRNIN